MSDGDEPFNALCNFEPDYSSITLCHCHARRISRDLEKVFLNLSNFQSHHVPHRRYKDAIDEVGRLIDAKNYIHFQLDNEDEFGWDPDLNSITWLFNLQTQQNRLQRKKAEKLFKTSMFKTPYGGVTSYHKEY
jgi:hypothetical protein